MIYYCFIFLICAWVPLCSNEIDEKLKHCLEECWGVDRHTSAFIHHQFKPLLDEPCYHPVIDEFVTLSQKFNIDFSIDKPLHPLPSEDGTIQSPKQHLVVFESPYVRILLGSTLPGGKEPMHLHAWKSLMVVIVPTEYITQYYQGIVDRSMGTIGVFEIPAGEHYSCENIGPKADLCLRFEIK